MLATDTNRYFPSFDRLTSLIFEKMYEYHVNTIVFLSVALSHKNKSSWKKVARWAHISTTLSTFPQDNQPSYQYAANLWTFHFIPLGKKKMCTQRFNKINNFYCFIKGILKWKHFFQFFCKHKMVKNTLTTGIVCYYYPDLCWSASSFTHHCFCTIGPNVNTF